MALLQSSVVPENAKPLMTCNHLVIWYETCILRPHRRRRRTRRKIKGRDDTRVLQPSLPLLSLIPNARKLGSTKGSRLVIPVQQAYSMDPHLLTRSPLPNHQLEITVSHNLNLAPHIMPLDRHMLKRITNIHTRNISIRGIISKNIRPLLHIMALLLNNIHLVQPSVNHLCTINNIPDMETELMSCHNTLSHHLVHLPMVTCRRPCTART